MPKVHFQVHVHYSSQFKPHVSRAVAGIADFAPVCAMYDDIMEELWHESAAGNAERGGAEALKLRPSLRCLPLTCIPPP